MDDFPVIYGRGDKMNYFDYVKEYQMEHPNLSWMQAVKKASPSYHKMQGHSYKKGGEKPYIRDNPKPNMKLMREMALDAVGGYGTSEGAYRGWETKDREMGQRKASKREKKKALKAAGAWFGDKRGHQEAALKGWSKRNKSLGKSQKSRKEKKEMKSLAGVMAAGIMAGYEPRSERERAAIKGWVKRYKSLGESQKSRKEQKKLGGAKQGERGVLADLLKGLDIKIM